MAWEVGELRWRTSNLGLADNGQYRHRLFWLHDPTCEEPESDLGSHDLPVTQTTGSLATAVFRSSGLSVNHLDICHSYGAEDSSNFTPRSRRAAV